MNDHVDPASGADAEDPSSPASEVKPKPVRRKRAVAGDAGSTVAGDMSADAASATPAEAEGEPEAAAKPRRKRAPPKVEAGAVDAQVSEASATVGIETPSDLPTRAHREPALQSAESSQRDREPVRADTDRNDEGLTKPTQRADTDTDTNANANADTNGTGTAGTDANDDGESGDGTDGVDGPRSRRRNRRDRKRRGARADDGDGSGSGSEGFIGPLQPKAPPPQATEVFAQVLSGAFDTVVDAPEGELEAPDTKRVLAPEPEAPKLHKVLAQSGIGSRRDMEALIADGFVTVNGEPAHTGQRVSFGDQVHVKGKPVRLRIVPPPPRIIAYHKPVGEIVTHDDPQARPTVFRRLPRLQQGKWQSVGRLDINTEGLLLFTTSGGLANQLMHPRFGVEREYAVRVLGKLSEGDRAQLLEGVEVDGQKAQFRSINDGGGEGANHWYRCVITEGRNREVRKLFDAVELTVSRLIRIRYGTVVLPHGLKRGAWVDLDEADIRAIRRLASGEAGEGQPRHAPNGARHESARGETARSDNAHNDNAHNDNVRSDNGRIDNGRTDGPRDDRQGGQPPPRQNGPRNKNDRQRQGGQVPNNGPWQGSGNGSYGGNGNVGNGNGGNGSNANRPRPDDARPAALAHEDREPRFARDDDDEEDHGPIPNPLEQTFDKRFVTNPRSPAGGRGFGRGGGGFGAGGSAPPPDPNRGSGPRQPDPMQTSVGYIGADAFHRKNKNRGPRGGGAGGGGGGGFGGSNSGGGYKGGGGGNNSGGRRGR